MRLSLALLLTLPCVFAQGDPKLFDYDTTTAFDYKETLVRTHEGVTVFDSSFISPKGGRVPCYVVVPAPRKGKSAAIVWQHGGGQNRQWFLPDAIALAHRGAVSILLDAPFVRSKDVLGAEAEDEDQRSYDRLVQVAVDVRRAIDVLVARPDVDPQRIGYVGLSFGAMLGATLSGFETRLKTFVLDAGLEGFGRHYKESPLMADLRERLGPERLAKMVARVDAIDNVHFIVKATAPMLFQAARYDWGVTEEHTYDFFAASTSAKKELRWYDSGHNLNHPQAAADREAWLRKYLKIK